MNINPERPYHAVFKGLTAADWRFGPIIKIGMKPGPAFRIVSSDRRVQMPESTGTGLDRHLADYDRGLEGIALCEMFSGKGSVILSGFEIIPRAGLDPVADRLLLNLVKYAADGDHEAHPFVETRIEWGNYATEKGTVSGPANGLVVNRIGLASDQS